MPNYDDDGFTSMVDHVALKIRMNLTDARGHVGLNVSEDPKAYTC